MNRRSLFYWCLPLLALGLAACDPFAPKDKVPTGTLFVMSQPEGAVVECNGKVLGTTPLQAGDVPAGTLLLVVRREGFQTVYQTVNLAAGERLVREYTLTPVRGLVLVRSNPPGAAVELNGAFAGNTPLPLHNVALGEHRMRLSLQGYSDRSVEFKVEGRIPQSVDVEMVSNAGVLVVYSTPPGASVFVDGRNEGVTPLSLPRVEKGTREIVLQLAGHEPHRVQVLVNPGETAQVDSRLNPLPGALRVVSIPVGARVYVDDAFQGQTPVNLEPFAPGTYVVRAELRGHATETRTVTVGRGGETVEEFRMERNSGILEIITRPADVRVYVDSELVGTTKARGSDVVSEPLQIDLLSEGSHTLQLVRKGYVFTTKRFFITKDMVTTLDESMRRQFIPNTLVRTGAGQDNAITGVLVRRHLNGDVELEVREGIFRTIPAKDVVSVVALREEETIDAPEPVPLP